jgi:hypothetical protein
MASLDKIPVSDVMPFIISQVLGGLVAVQLFKRRTNWGASTICRRGDSHNGYGGDEEFGV